MVCTVILAPRTIKNLSKFADWKQIPGVTAVQWEFEGGYIGHIVTFAQGIARSRQMRIVPIVDFRTGEKTVLVDCVSERRASAEWLDRMSLMEEMSQGFRNR